jgi:hypothetical protein
MWCSISNWMYKYRGLSVYERDLERSLETCDSSVPSLLEEIILRTPLCLYLMHDKFLSHLSRFTIGSGSCTWNQQFKLRLNPPACTAIMLYICIQQVPVITQAVQRVLLVSLSTSNQISWIGQQLVTTRFIANSFQVLINSIVKKQKNGV